MRFLFVIPALVALVGCSGTKSGLIRTEMDQTPCSATSLRGYGFAANSVDAQNEAFNQIATQIKSSVEYSSRSTKVVTTYGGNENIESTYLMESAAKASISNAENVQVVYSKSGSDGTGVVACMERSAAAAPFVKLFQSVRDSFEMEANGAIGEKHPQKKFESFRRGLNLYNKMVQSSEVVATLGQVTEQMDGELVRSKEAREKLVLQMQDFKSNYSVTIAEDSATMNEAVSGLLRETFLNMNKFDGSDKPNGVRVVVSAGEMKCSDGIFGFVCEVGISVRIVSMDGEVYVEYSDSLKSSSSVSKEDAANRIPKSINQNNNFIQKVEEEISNWMI
ncbi:MAG: LPP20 family lipoprotein [Fibrobacter sp.]|nr:LPP20 family lipoprotein [Fibrobacter sp.]